MNEVGEIAASYFPPLRFWKNRASIPHPEADPPSFPSVEAAVQPQLDQFSKEHFAHEHIVGSSESDSTFTDSSRDDEEAKLAPNPELLKRFRKAKHTINYAKHKLRKRDLGQEPQKGFLEVFCGCGELAFQMKQVGFRSLGLDCSSNKDRPRCTAIVLDLTTASGQATFWKLVVEYDVAWVHFAPPCGTASRARERRLFDAGGLPAALDPQPLRSDEHPDGLPNLEGSDLERVKAANVLYKFVADAAQELTRRNILYTVENPTNSLMWPWGKP